MEKILCPTIHVHRQHDCSYVDVGTVCYTVSCSMFVYLRASLDNVCSLDLPYCTVYNTTESPSEYWRIMSGRKQFNMASWLKPPNPTITQGLIQCQWCDLKLRRSAQGYAIVRKVHVENRDPLRKKLKFGKVKLRTPDACTTGTNPNVPQGNQDSRTSGNPNKRNTSNKSKGKDWCNGNVGWQSICSLQYQKD